MSYFFEEKKIFGGRPNFFGDNQNLIVSAYGDVQSTGFAVSAGA